MITKTGTPETCLRVLWLRFSYRKATARTAVPEGRGEAVMRATGITARVALGCAALAALGVAGCSSAHAINTGPFGNGYSPGSICGVVSPGGVATYGVEELRN